MHLSHCSFIRKVKVKIGIKLFDANPAELLNGVQKVQHLRCAFLKEAIAKKYDILAVVLDSRGSTMKM